MGNHLFSFLFFLVFTLNMDSNHSFSSLIWDEQKNENSIPNSLPSYKKVERLDSVDLQTIFTIKEQKNDDCQI